MLRQQLEQVMRGLSGKVGLYYKDLTTGEEIFYAEGEDRFEAASVIKLAIMAEAFRQVEEGRLTPETRVVLRSQDKVPSGETPHYGEEWAAGRIAPGELYPESGVLNYLHDGTELTLADLYTVMIVISDNTATNLLIDLLGKDRINQLLESLGFTATRLARKLFEQPENGEKVENYISVREMGQLLELIYRGQLISEKASRDMAAVLTNQQVNHKIPFYISDLPIAHKTGEDSGITNDVAIVYGDRPFILCLAANETDVPETERAYQDIARLIRERGGEGL